MNVMLDFYKTHCGEPKHQGNGFNGPCPLCGGDRRKSDRFIIWPDKTNGIGKTCLANNISGVYFCRQCGITGTSFLFVANLFFFWGKTFTPKGIRHCNFVTASN